MTWHYITYIHNEANVSQCWFLKVVPFVSLAGDTAKTSAKHEFRLFEERPSRTARWGNFGVAIRFAWQNWAGNRNRWFKLEKEQQAKKFRPQTAKVAHSGSVVLQFVSFCNWKPMFSTLEDTLPCFATQYWLMTMTTYFWANNSSCSAALFSVWMFYCYKPSPCSEQVRFEIDVKWHQSGLRSCNMYRCMCVCMNVSIYIYIHTYCIQYITVCHVQHLLCWVQRSNQCTTQDSLCQYTIWTCACCRCVIVCDQV